MTEKMTIDEYTAVISNMCTQRVFDDARKMGYTRASLEDPQRALQLYGVTTKDIALTMGWTLATARANLHQARAAGLLIQLRHPSGYSRWWRVGLEKTILERFSATLFD